MFLILSKLAKSTRYQNLYARAKELTHIRLFYNEYDFSYLQILFLNYLEIYHSLYTDLASKAEHLSEEVINDDLRLEAYLFWKRVHKDKKYSDKNQKQISQDGGVIFKR